MKIEVSKKEWRILRDDIHAMAHLVTDITGSLKSFANELRELELRHRVEVDDKVTKLVVKEVEAKRILEKIENQNGDVEGGD